MYRRLLPQVPDVDSVSGTGALNPSRSVDAGTFSFGVLPPVQGS